MSDDVLGLPSSWCKVRISDVADVNPKGLGSGFAPADGDEVHFVPMSAVAPEFGGIDVSQRRPFAEVRKGYTQFSENDVLLAKITPCMENGKLAIVPELPARVGFGSTEFHVLRSGEAVQPAWLALYLSQQAFRKKARQNMTGSAGQLRVSTGWLSSAELPLPPAAEQTRIVEKLEELLSDLDAGVAELKAAQAKLQHYRQSLLKAAVEGSLTRAWREAHPAPEETGADLLARILRERRARWEAQQLAKFEAQDKAPPKGWQAKYPEPAGPDAANLPDLPHGWQWASLDQLVGESSYGTSAKCDYQAEGLPVLRIPNVSKGKIDFRNMKFATVDLALSEGDELGTGDVLVIRTNGSIGLVGRAAAVTTAPASPHYFASYLLRLRCVEARLTPRWVAHVLASSSGRQWLEARAASSAGQHNISLSTLLTMPVPLPALPEQEASLALLGDALDGIEVHENAVNVSLAQSTAQRQNLLRAAFAGQLVPQDPADEPASALLARIRAERAAQGSAGKPRVSPARGAKSLNSVERSSVGAVE